MGTPCRRDPPDSMLDKGMRKALVLGPVSDMTNFTLPSEPPSGASCSTGNCTFAPYHSLGMCVRTANITSHPTVTKYDNNTQRGDKPLMADSTVSAIVPGAMVYAASLPGGFELAHQGPLAVNIDMLAGSDSFGFSTEDEEDVGPLGSRVASLILASISSFRHEALEVLFYLCVQRYETSISNGVEKSELVGELARPVVGPATAAAGLPFLDMNRTAFVSADIPTCYPNRRLSGITPAGEREHFSANYLAMERTAQAMKGLLAGYTIDVYDPQLFPNAAYASEGSRVLLTVFEDVRYRLDSSANATNSEYYQIRLTNFYHNIATAVSSMLRVGAPQRYTHDAFNATGVGRREVSFVHVTWGWLAFLAAELILAAALIPSPRLGCMTAEEARSPAPCLRTSRTRRWRSSQR
ncbi:uncharacterized protein DNG_10220 [Cephalotrichum gorgonifer]|uniref:Uncharacterized protein n=1 Tax=Cephalotrichum gorgonifer TaxID=2041049 RepID=A0AAE8N782_9PEZI|nr:uncharacterized protein DNG_10220 [Cephalotrichum gorgonifer]